MLYGMTMIFSSRRRFTPDVLKISLRGLTRSVLFALGFLFLSAATGPSVLPAAHVLDTALPAQASTSEHEGLPNFGRVTPTIYRSAQPTPEGYRSAKRIGIKSVISLRAEPDDAAAVQAAGLMSFHVPLHASDPPTPADEAKLLALISDTRNQPVLIHCRRGIDRTGAIVAMYRVRRQGWSTADAYAEMKRYGYWKWLFPSMKGYVHQLKPDSAAGAGNSIRK